MPSILLVEDNELNRDMLSRRLERKGYTVAIAVDGRQAVDMAAATPYDLILMDMSLPASPARNRYQRADFHEQVIRGSFAFLQDAGDFTVEAAAVVFGEVFGGDDDDGNLFGVRAAAKFLHEGESVHLRHHQVQQDQRRDTFG